MLVLLFLLMGAPAALFGACVIEAAVDAESARALERLRWWSIWRPLLPATTVGALLMGWAIVEPHPSDEPVSFLAAVAALPFAFVWCRALLRALVSARHRGPAPLAATVGLLRPRVVVSPALHRVLDGGAVAAIRHHERAHAAHRDPLRIWLAQIATDLQWPVPAAELRWREWRRALEIARDEEVREAGTDGLALAAGILGVASLTVGRASALPAFFDDELSFRERIEWLLAPSAADTGRSPAVPARWLVLYCLAGIAGGVLFGDSLVRALLGALA
jgi:Zn-dependent protease with chaperone function